MLSGCDGVYGARKLWKAARRVGLDMGRDQVARLMSAEGFGTGAWEGPDPPGEPSGPLRDRAFTGHYL